MPDQAIASDNIGSIIPALPWWVITIALIAATLMAVGAGIALVRPGLLTGSVGPVTPEVRIFAAYLVSRNLAIAALLFLALVTRARPLLGAMLLLTGLVQAVDAVFDATDGRLALVPGIAIFAAALLASAFRLRAAPALPAAPTEPR